MKALLITLLATIALQANTPLESIIQKCIDDKRKYPERSCVTIAQGKTIHLKTTELIATTFYLCATACEKPELHLFNKE